MKIKTKAQLELEKALERLKNCTPEKLYPKRSVLEKILPKKKGGKK